MQFLFILLTVIMLFSVASAADSDSPFISGKAFRIKNRIDKLHVEALKKHGVAPAPLCGDAVFVRRVYVDLLGALPTVKEVRSFLHDKDLQKRRKLIETLLVRPEFVDFQAMRWCDELRVKSEFPINLWPNGAACYYRWIHGAVAENMPYDRFVRELLTANGSNFRDGPANFYRAVATRDAAALGMALAEMVSQTFLGIDIGSRPAEKQRELAVFFSRIGYKETAQWKEEIVFWNREPLDVAELVFPDGSRKPVEPERDPRREFADWLISPDNAAFNRAAVNRIWSRLFGTELHPKYHSALLDFLAVELVRSKYDQKQIFRLILNSGVYQQSSIPAGSGKENAAEEHVHLFASYPIRRLEAEVLQDVLARLFNQPVGYTSEVPEPFTYVPARYRTILLPDSGITSSFLEMFGRASRDTGTKSDRDNGVTESQQLFLLNSTEVNSWVSRFSQRYRNLQKGEVKPALDELWLVFLSRYPTEAEYRIADAELRRNDKPAHQRTQDLIWSLLNTKEFLCKH